MLRLLGTDLDGPDIARELTVSLSTVRTHTKSIYAKLGVNNRRAAVRRRQRTRPDATNPRPLIPAHGRSRSAGTAATASRRLVHARERLAA